MQFHSLLLMGLPLFQSLTSVQAQPQPSDCSDPAGIVSLNPQCWTALNISQHIMDWSATHDTTCQSGTPFASCFLRVLDMGQDDCVSITSSTCPTPSWIQFKKNNISVEDFYVAYNIYSVYTFFNGYYTAIGNARSAATDSIGAIVALLDPPKKTNGFLNDLLTALSVGLSFLAPDAGPLVGAIVTGLQQSPGLAKFLFPVGPLDTQVAQFDQIANSMGTVTTYLQHNVTQALAAIQQDAQTFLAITGSGNFSVTPVPTISDQSDSILTALNTYVISQCLQANNWVIARAIDTDVNELQVNGSAAGWDIPNCGNGYDGNSLCGAYYFNKAIDVSFTLTNNGDLSNDPTSAMDQLFANWTTPDQLFNGAAQCQVQGGSALVVTTGASGLDVSCLSNLKVCTWDLDPSHIGVEYEFIDCDTQRGVYVDGCKGCPDGDICVNVPYSYIGNYLTYTGWGLPYDFCIKDGNIIEPSS